MKQPPKAKAAVEMSEVLVREGESVKAGQVLVKMDTSEYQARQDQDKRRLAAARGQLDIATKARDNNKALLAKGFISQNAFDNAESQYRIARANVDSAKGALDVAQKSLGDTVIRAPISAWSAAARSSPAKKYRPTTACWMSSICIRWRWKRRCRPPTS